MPANFPRSLFVLAGCVLLGAAGGSATALENEMDIPVLEIYIDSENGSDANSGKNPGDALQTLGAAQEKMDAVPSNSPIVLNLARGSVWRETRKREKDDFTDGGQVLGGGVEALVVRAYGEGDKPTISGWDPLPNEGFEQPDPKGLPKVWRQTVKPPQSFYTRYMDETVATRPGLMAGDRAFRAIWTADSPLTVMRDFARSFQGLETEEQVLEFVNQHEGFYYPRLNADGTVDFFINPGSNPKEDGLEYRYKARAPAFGSADAVWEGIRIVGSNARHGPSGKPVRISDVEVLHGNTHNFFMGTGWIEDVVSIGYEPSGVDGVLPQILHPRQDEYVDAGSTALSETFSLFHTHQRDAQAGLIYDRVFGKNGSIAFFDHRGDAHRPFVIIRDSTTENVRLIVAHRNESTDQLFLLGHRHSGPDGLPGGSLGEGAVKENYVEDCVLRLGGGSAVWNATPLQAPLFKMNNSAVSVRSLPAVVVGPGMQLEFLHSTLIVDLEGQSANGGLIDFIERKSETPGAEIVFRNCVLAVVGGPEGKSVALFANEEAAKNTKVRLENCVLVNIDEIPASAGTKGTDFQAANFAEVFAGDPASGNFSLNPEGPAVALDAGYSEGRDPVYRLVADQLAATVPRENATLLKIQP